MIRKHAQDDLGHARSEWPGRTIRLDLAYEGTHYHGFGIQPGQPTIQEVLEQALSQALDERVRVTPAGRTDAGVHASGQVVSLRTRGRLDAAALLRATNARLPEDVLVTNAAEMPSAFGARRSALRRQYQYAVWNQPTRNLWLRRWSWHVPGPLDLDRLRAASARLVGQRDFSGFVGGMAREPRSRSTVRTIERAEWGAEGGILKFEVTADAFLRHMVRAIVGTLVWVARGRLDTEQLDRLLDGAERGQAGPNAPAAGLMLTRVEYPEEFRVQGSRFQEDALLGTRNLER